MSRLIRTLLIGATLTAMHLAGMTAVAQADQQPAGEQVTLRPPTEGQVGEPWRHRQAASPEQAAADAAHRRQTAQEQSYDPTATPAQAPAPEPANSSGQPGWLIALVGVLVAVLVAGLAMLAARRTRGKARLGPAA